MQKKSMLKTSSYLFETICSIAFQEPTIKCRYITTKRSRYLLFRRLIYPLMHALLNFKPKSELMSVRLPLRDLEHLTNVSCLKMPFDIQTAFEPLNGNINCNKSSKMFHDLALN